MCVIYRHKGVWDTIKHGDDVEEHKDKMLLPYDDFIFLCVSPVLEYFGQV